MTDNAATVRDCPECGRHDEHAMVDGEWICHSCGHVEFPPGRDPAAPWRDRPAATTLLVIEGPDTYRRTFVPPGVGRIEVYVGVDGVTFRFDGEEVEDDDE